MHLLFKLFSQRYGHHVARVTLDVSRVGVWCAWLCMNNIFTFQVVLNVRLRGVVQSFCSR